MGKKTLKPLLILGSLSAALWLIVVYLVRVEALNLATGLLFLTAACLSVRCHRSRGDKYCLIHRAGSGQNSAHHLRQLHPPHRHRPAGK